MGTATTENKGKRARARVMVQLRTILAICCAPNATRASTLGGTRTWSPSAFDACRNLLQFIDLVFNENTTLKKQLGVSLNLTSLFAYMINRSWSDSFWCTHFIFDAVFRTGGLLSPHTHIERGVNMSIYDQDVYEPRAVLRT